MKKVYICMKNAGNLSLERLMKENKEGLSLDAAKDLFAQLATAITALHERNICHRDIKPDNIILSVDENKQSGYLLTVVDLNVAFDLLESKLITGATGLKEWSAPETRNALHYNEKCDIYSLGCILQLLLTGATPSNVVET